MNLNMLFVTNLAVELCQEGRTIWAGLLAALLNEKVFVQATDRNIILDAASTP
jgi:hypothetical protein